jgi:hypothetical protein
MPRFTRTNAPATTQQPPAAINRRSKWDGIKSSENRLPLLPAGEYRVRCKACEEKTNPVTRAQSSHITVEIVEAYEGDAKAGETYNVLLMQSVIGMREIKSLFMALAGFDSDEEFDQWDAPGYIDRSFGIASGHAETAIGAEADVQVRLGKACVNKDGEPTGDYYRNYLWAPVEA